MNELFGEPSAYLDDGCNFPLPDAFPVMFQVSNSTGRIVRVSETWLSALGYTRPDVIGRTDTDFLTDESAKFAKVCLEQFFEQGQLNEVLYDFRKKDGDVLPCVLSGSVLKSEDGRRIGSVFIINALKKNEAILNRLQRKSFRLHACLEGTNAGTWEWNVQTGVTVFNERWAEIVGYSLAELEPISIDTWLSLAHPNDLEASTVALTKHWEGKTDFYDFEARMRHKNGHWVWVHDRGRVCTWTDEGQPEWMFGTHFSIDEQRRQIDQTEHMKRLLDRTGNVAGVGGWEIELATNQVIWTAETRRIHGVDEDYVPTVEQGINFYAPEAREIITKAVEMSMVDGSAWDLELPFIRATGERIWVRAVGEVVFQKGAPSHIFGAFQDITNRVQQTGELQAAIAALEQSNAELDQFAYIASHDLKAPLRVIANAISWMEEDLGDEIDGTVRKSMDLVHSRVGRMDRLLTDLLEHSRIGRTEEDTKLVKCSDIFAEVRDLIGLRDGFRVEGGAGLDAVMLPRMPATKILLNLVGNAVKHHDRDNGFVLIEAKSLEESVIVTISDDGPGIPAKMQNRAFELFQTLRPRDQVEGSGMGLAIVQKAAKMAGGSVELFSEGRGCVFTVQLPCIATKQAQRGF
ncbi:hypothetical protein A8B78_11155 [Jannaschia sp. EhC01]|nr:hypothetical protein A8B78_11155 [Jannaschia sp. EhC01]